MTATPPGRPLGAGVRVPGAPVPLPLELAAVVALLALPGLWVVLAGLADVDDALDVWSFFGARFGLLVLILLAVVILTGVALIVIAVTLVQADRVGRNLAWVVAAALLWAVVVADERSTSTVIAAVCAAAGAAVLLLVPSVQAYFAGPWSPVYDQPVPVATARVLLLVLTGLLAALGLVYLLAADVRGRYVLTGLALLAAAAVCAVALRRLRVPDRQMRLVVSAVVAVGVVVVLATGGKDEGTLLPIGMLLLVPALLWLAPTARAWFGDGPLDVGRRPSGGTG